MAGMEDPSELQAGGVHLGGTKYMFIQSDDRMIAGKKVRFPSSQTNRETSQSGHRKKTSSKEKRAPRELRCDAA